jgi:hypothetical protein
MQQQQKADVCMHRAHVIPGDIKRQLTSCILFSVPLIAVWLLQRLKVPLER